MDSLAKEYGISQRIFDNLLKALDKACVDQEMRITEHIAALRKQMRAKPSLASPSKSTLPTGALNSSPSKQRKVASSRSDTGDGDDGISLLPKPPTKRQKVDTPSKSSIRRSGPKLPIESAIPSVSTSHNPYALRTPARFSSEDDSESSPASTPPVSPSPSTRCRFPDQNRVHSNAMDVDPESESEDDELPPPKRLRPVFLDHKKWEAPDP